MGRLAQARALRLRLRARFRLGLPSRGSLLRRPLRRRGLCWGLGAGGGLRRHRRPRRAALAPAMRTGPRQRPENLGRCFVGHRARHDRASARMARFHTRRPQMGFARLCSNRMDARPPIACEARVPRRPRHDSETSEPVLRTCHQRSAPREGFAVDAVLTSKKPIPTLKFVCLSSGRAPSVAAPAI